MLLRSLSFALFVTLSALVTLTAQRPTLSTAVRAYVSVDAPLIALTHARVIDGTGAAPREDQTLILNNGIITTIGSSASTAVPAGAQTIDLTGKSVIPGLVMVHEHLYYPNGPGVYGQLGESFSRLYLSGGVTTMRTGGNVNGFMDLNMMRLVEAGQKPGPAIDATAPYLNGPNTFIQMRTLKGPEDARRQVQYWTDEGATSLKTYMQITRGELAAAINEAHRRGIKVTGHLCSVTYAEAASLGIDNLEHGFFAATDFVADKKPDQCPGQGVGQKTIAALDENGAPFKTLVQTLIKANVALTSTLTVFETFTPGRPKPPGIEVLTPQLREQFEQNYARTSQNKESIYTTLFPKGMALERAFAKAGGLLIAGTDPTGGGGVIPGFANQRQVELLVDAGFTPLEAISISTLNGAKYLGRDKTRRQPRGRQAGRSGRHQRQSRGDDRRHPQGRDGVQAGRRLRPGEADRVGAGQSRASGRAVEGAQAQTSRISTCVPHSADLGLAVLALSVGAAAQLKKEATAIDKADPNAVAIAKGVDYLKVEVPKWKAEHPCYSCHNNGDATRALLVAGAKGYDIGTSLDDTLAFLKQPAKWDQNKAPSGFDDKTLARVQFASALAVAERHGKAASTDLDAAAKLLVADQKADGSWTARSVAEHRLAGDLRHDHRHVVGAHRR